MAKAAERAGLMGAWDVAEFCTELLVRGFLECCGVRGPVDLVKMLTGAELEVASELGA